VLSDRAPARRRLPRRSPRQEYEEYVSQRIEDYKNQLTREELLALADDAVRELDAGPDGQLVLTEVLVLEHVDRLIKRRLRLPGQRRWSGQHQRLREAQRQPTHWGLPADVPFSRLLETLESCDGVVTIGSGAASAAYLLAAHEIDVLAVVESVEAAEGVETRAADQALTHHVQTVVVALGEWFPEDVRPGLVILDPLVFSRLDATLQVRTMTHLRDATMQAGRHLILPVEHRGAVRSLAPEALLNHYAGWRIERGTHAHRRWFLAVKP
jgi:hypothetical protein